MTIARRLCWYAAEKYLRDLKAKEEFPSRVLDSVDALADFLVAESRTIERGTDAAKRTAKEEVPGDRVKDAPALARELRWRVRAVQGYGSEDEGRVKRKTIATMSSGGGAHVNGNGSGKEVNGSAGKKRKRAEEEMQTLEVEELASYVNGAAFMHFKPRRWDTVVTYPAEKEERAVKRARPPHPAEGADEEKGKGKWVEAWTGKEDEGIEMTEAGEAKVEVRRDVVVKVRRTTEGIERQRVERVLEEWTWDDEEPAKPATSSPSKEPAANGNGSQGENVPVDDPSPPPPASTGDGDVQMAAEPVAQ